MFNCKVMRQLLAASATLLLLGILLITLVSQVFNQAGAVSVAINTLGIFSLLAAPVVLTGLTLLALFPSARKALTPCNH